MIDWNEEALDDEGGAICFKLSGSLDASSCDYLYSVLEERVDGGCKRLILDCQSLEFISSMGLGMLLRIHARLSKRGGDVKLARVHGPVADVFKIVRLDKLFHLYPTVQEAADSYDA